MLVASEGLGLLLLLATILVTARSKVPVWKASLLPALFLGSNTSHQFPGPQECDNKSGEHVNNLTSSPVTLNDMRKLARRKKVRLVQDEQGELSLHCTLT
jgi:hypothetical protein